eukprot:snap_masked-scaffold_4-processed-gene-17.33-mRNA-1 protein AED:0.00 eAED:0.00 QI:0/-1/0/1/-1/1/1/0/141
MNSSFRSVLKQSLEVAKEPLSHQQRVTRLYRAMLKNQFHWSVHRDVYIQECQKIHDGFRQLKDLPEKESLYYLEKYEAKLKDMAHPEPYIIPWMPGGSKFMRNPTPPPEVVYAGEEIPEDARTGTNTPIHLDSIPVTFRPH